MAKLLIGQATGSETQEIKRVLLTLLDMQPMSPHPPPLPMRPERLAIEPTKPIQNRATTGATAIVKDTVEVLSTPKDIKRYEKYLEKQKRKVVGSTKE